MTAEEEQCFQLAVGAARQLVSQSLAHAERVSARMGDRVAAAVLTSPVGVDRARMLGGEHPIAFQHILEHVEATSNALVSQLTGLKLLLDNDTFHPLPASVIARAIAEVAASCAWIVRPADSNTRFARGYAALFFALQRGISDAAPGAGLKEQRDELIEQLKDTQVVLEHRLKGGIQQEDIGQVFVGAGPNKDRGRAKVSFTYSQRVQDEIPRVGPLYSALSGAVHGSHASIRQSWKTPDSGARAIAHVVTVSTEAWSAAVHEWVGVQAGPFLNERDRQNVLLSIPEATYARVAGKIAAAVKQLGSANETGQ